MGTKTTSIADWIDWTASLGDAQFGLTTFFAAKHPAESCGSNGLPLTPNSVQILGNFQKLKCLKHSNLCTYLDLVRGKHERMIVVSEYHSKNLKCILQHPVYGLEDKIRFLSQALQGLSYLHDKRICHRQLSLENITITSDGTAKLFNYGLYAMTQGGSLVSFPIGFPKYFAPEILLSNTRPKAASDDKFYALDHATDFSPAFDIWAFGLITLELITGKLLWPSNSKLSAVLRKICGLIYCTNSASERLIHELGALTEWQALRPCARDFIEQCLQILPSERASAKSLLQHSLFSHLNPSSTASACSFCLESSQTQNTVSVVSSSTRQTKIDTFSVSMLSQRPLHEAYYLWQLAGGDPETELVKQGLIRPVPPIATLPTLIVEEGESFGQPKDRATLLDTTVVAVNLVSLHERFRCVPCDVFQPPLEPMERPPSLKDAASLPLLIREKDIEYQLHRIALFERLLKAYPSKRSLLVKEARQDIPPLYRGLTWASILRVEAGYESVYASIDKETPTVTDRQIEVDVPRCHQYMDLLASPEGHRKLKRVLKAWVASHPQYVYWQGLDSLCAPFLYLNFNNEALAYACVAAFIPKYLHGFFLQDNSAIIQEYLAKFAHLIAFHDPDLTNHLESIGFVADLYAIPWFLTMFAHVFPLHKIFHLWDNLLLGNHSFPLCIGFAVLKQLRATLLDSGFNECILLFSDMPEIDMEKVVKDSIDCFCRTPESITYRQYQPNSDSKKKAHDLTHWDTEFAFSSLGMDPTSLSVLKSEKVPRISAADLIDLLDLNRSKYPKPIITVIDVRDPNKFQRGAVPNSLNIPFANAFNSDGTLVQTTEIDALQAEKGVKILAVVGSSRNDLSLKFAHALLALGFPKVCVLHKGFDVLSKTSILIVPASMGAYV